MSRIRGADTKPEIMLRKALWSKGLRYQLRRRIESARPDLVFLRARVAVFVDGCQWHGCPDHYVQPRTRESFWGEKIRRTVERDIEQTKGLEDAGWRVARFWEHDIHTRIRAVADEVECLIAGDTVAGSEQWRVWRVLTLNEHDLERRFMLSLRTGAATTVDRLRRTTKWKTPTRGDEEGQ